MADAEEILVIKGKRLLLPDCISSGCIIVKNGKVVGIERGIDTTHLSTRAKVSLDKKLTSSSFDHSFKCRFSPLPCYFFRKKGQCIDAVPKPTKLARESLL